MGSHLINGEFQSDKYPTTPPGKVPLSVKDETAQDLLWEYAQRRRAVDAEFAADLEQALMAAGYKPKAVELSTLAEVEERHVRDVLRACSGNKAQAARALGIDRRSLYRRLGSPASASIETDDTQEAT